MPDLLLELFSEEIPARMQPRACADLKRLVTERLVEAGLTYAEAGAFATPRRLCLHVTGLPAQTQATREERRGPRTDAPEKAVEGFLRATGLSRDRLEVREEKKGAAWYAVIEHPGRAAAEVVVDAVAETIRAFPWPKSMRWGDGSLRWVRPLHAILCILTDEQGAEVVPVEIEGVAAADRTRGHRFMGGDPFRVASFEDYVEKLKQARVILDPAERAARIEHDARQLAFAQGLEVVEDKGLLAEVAGLVEWPVTMMGAIDPEFLDLPAEVLQVSMKEHQKFFSVRNPATGRIERFVTVANIEASDGGKQILAGNRRVLAARLDNGRFFWDSDVRVVKGRGMEGIAEMAKPLENMVFHARLGTQAERVERIAALAREIAPKVGADPDLAEQAARVAKADLASEMVFEFPELQGVMGRYYAQAAGLPDAVAEASEAHYRPLGPSDEVPSEPVSVAVALADKIDMLTGFWVIDEKPTGSKDPFALRRAAVGAIRIVLEEYRLALKRLFFKSIDNFIAKQHFTPYDNFLWQERSASGVIDFSAQTASDLFKCDLLLDFCERFDLTPRAKINELISIINERDSLDKKGKLGPVTSETHQKLDRKFMQACRELHDQLEPLGKVWMYYKDPLIGDEPEAEAKQRKEIFAWVEGVFNAIAEDLLAFFADRLKVALRDEGIRHDVIQACFDLGGQDDLVLLVNRVRALQDFLATEDGANLLTGYRRAANIVDIEEKKEGGVIEYSGEPDPKFAELDEERALFVALDEAGPAIAGALECEDFRAAMAEMAKLRPVIDAFFDRVTVNAENRIVRRNRLCLLNRIREVMRQVAVWEAIEG